MDMTQTPIQRLILKLSPPVMLALLIQSVYNIVDSFFIAQYSNEGLTALSIVYPVQLLMTALATGTGAGVNLLISRMDGQGETEKQPGVVTCGLVLALTHYVLFAVLEFFLATPYFRLSSTNEIVNTQGVIYTNIVFAGSLGIFIESICTKILQAMGNMTLPMAAQVMGAVINIILDPILIFGLFGAPCLGITGAAIATVMGQWLAMIITFIAVRRIYPQYGQWNKSTCLQIYQDGSGSIVTQSLYTLYIVGLNMILALFSEDAVTVLGIYYKIQSFFFIPLLGLQQVLLPVISHNFGAGQEQRIRQTVKFAAILSTGLMLAASLVFLLFPRALLAIFSSKNELLQIGEYAFRVISLSFIPAGITIVVTSHLQGIAKIRPSVFLIVLRQVILLVPLAWVLHFAGLKAVWWTFPLTELIVATLCIIFEKSKICQIEIK
ncbi:MAG: MATE family efflux transporter [Phascolarctobacterium sp.]|uniref:MATE family efflux transporter n=1 Tax=Phascolarctobacterium sp. TaxID=2049039 RepID=UPI0026DC1A45|nr:MATE family efflux transporter [Phascolarctobacterium sp.]MDO4920675.1 MATE family efflux transporter [Phascolarctobacterium sp.]